MYKVFIMRRNFFPQQNILYYLYPKIFGLVSTLCVCSVPACVYMGVSMGHGCAVIYTAFACVCAALKIRLKLASGPRFLYYIFFSLFISILFNEFELRKTF